MENELRDEDWTSLNGNCLRLSKVELWDYTHEAGILEDSLKKGKD